MLLRKILFPFSLFYALVVRVRNYMYDAGIKKAAVFKTKTICIGNLSVGGTGKTPMVEYLIANLQNEFKIAVLSRGYKRKSKGFLLANSQSNVEAMGDEPFQIFSKFPDIHIAVDANRQNGISLLEEKVMPDVILLDDAYQHRKVTAGFNILLTSYGKLYCDDWYLPTGNLRDSKTSANRADLIVVTKCPTALSDVEQKRIQKKLKPTTNQKVLFSTLAYSTEFYGKKATLSLADIKKRKITLVTGIADPEPLVGHLEQLGLSFEHLAYQDHHFFTVKELKALNERALILTTEKDFMRLNGKVHALFYISVKHCFMGSDAILLSSAINSFMTQGA